MGRICSRLPGDNSPAALIIIENIPYPADRRVWNQARTLRDAGYRVSVISPVGLSRWTRTFERIDGVEVHRFRLPGTGPGAIGFVIEYAAAFVQTLRLSLQAFRWTPFKTVQVCNPPDIFFLHGALFKLLGASFVFDQHDLAPEMFVVRFGQRWWAPIVLAVLRLCEWLTYRTADVVMVTNQSCHEIARGRGGVRPERLFVVRNGPDEQRMESVPPVAALKRGRAYLVCFVGLMGTQDGVDLAVRAAQWIVRQADRADVTFAFVGDGDQRSSLQALADQLGISAYVDFPGFVEGERLMQYLCTADVGIVPDPANGLNEKLTMIKVMEYMAVRLPIAAFALRENQFSAGGAAAYARPNDHVELGRRILDLLGDPERRRRMGQIGRRRVEEALSWEHSRPQLLDAYQAARSAGQRRRVAREHRLPASLAGRLRATVASWTLDILAPRVRRLVETGDRLTPAAWW